MNPEGTPRYSVEVLNGNHNRKAFTCGVAELDRYLATQAGQEVRRRVATVFILHDINRPGTIAGYYTLSSASIILTDLPEGLSKKLPRYPQVPATLLGRLAIGIDYRGLRLGEALLYDAIKRCRETEIATYALVTDAKDETALSFYRRYDFQPFPDKPMRLFLPLGRAI